MVRMIRVEAAGLVALRGIISFVHAWFHEQKLPSEVRLGLPLDFPFMSYHLLPS